ncbi:Synaptotagmin 1 [Seminavis robusta]|uniref:Synaptotagmin 1 n=1 Tax=Seminavis robusta TaxID=568900 RepID=A0A9N8HRP3_9STRA|nr:Synaptotagmin 1 [Seminavis robusta]|eukprot:Sro1343_g264630.1 Synaptotagmin 1 (133) ;mRNA; f:17266-17664
MGVLMVFLEKATKLTNRDVVGKSDPYVKFHLKQDNWVMDKNFGKAKSTTQQDNLDPYWNETYAFDIPSLDKMLLNITVLDEDLGPDQHLGECTIPLDQLGLTDELMDVDRIIDGNSFHKDARIYLKLSYKES